MSENRSKHHRKDDDESAKHDERNRQRSSLKFMDADLKVIVGEDPSEGNKEGEREVYWHFRTILASQSGYVDTLLSTSLPTDSDSNPTQDYREITFPDITPSQWDRMIQFLIDPFALESMSVNDAIELAVLYDKYEFKTGIKICDDILCKKAVIKVRKLAVNTFNGIIKPFNSTNVHDPSDVDQCVQAIVLSERINLRKTFYWGRMWLFSIFVKLNSDGPVAGFPLTASQITQLVPTIIKDNQLKYVTDHETSFIGHNEIQEYLNGCGEEIGLRLKDEIRIDGRTTDITNPMFPDFFIAMHEKNFVQESSSCVKVLYPDDVDYPAAGAYIWEESNICYSTYDEDGQPLGFV